MRIYICSPLRGNIAENWLKARNYCRAAALDGHTPIAPHIYAPQFLDENKPEERELGLAIGLDLLEGCQELWYYTTPPSAGMKVEIERAEALGIPVRYKGLVSTMEVKESEKEIFTNR